MKIDVMTKDKDIKTVVPALRFPEFRDGEGWKRTPILEICEIIGGGTPTSSNDVYWNGDIPWISSSDINENNISEITPTRHITKDAIKNSATKLCKAPSIHIVSRVGVGKVAFSRVDICTSQDFTNLCNINCNYIFLSYLLSIIMKQKVQETQGTSIKGIASAEIKNLHVPLPEIEEQQRIADCLSSLDDLISAVADKIETLKEYKKGLMQQLFPAEGKTTPAFRFPEFQNAGEWKDTTLGEEVYYENGKAHENDINETGKYIVVNSKFISTDGEVVKYTDNPSCLANKGDILMVLSDVPNGRAIAKCFIVDCNNKYTVNQRVCKLTPKKAVALLLYYSINRNPFLLAFDDGIKQTNLKKDDVLNCLFRLPQEPQEQQRIADCLLSVDELISTEIAKLDQLKAHKKGLMQPIS